MNLFLQEHKYIDFSSPNIQEKAAELFGNLKDDIQKSQVAFEFVRDEIPHTFDINSDIITARASDVLKRKTGICHAKANLLAALLRSQSIPVGFCFQRVIMSNGAHAVHCYNAIFIDVRWIKIDARGNKPGVNAQFSIDEPILAFKCRPEYNEYFWPGIYAAPHNETMQILDQANCLQNVLDNIPDMIAEQPDILE